MKGGKKGFIEPLTGWEKEGGKALSAWREKKNCKSPWDRPKKVKSEYGGKERSFWT